MNKKYAFAMVAGAVAVVAACGGSNDGSSTSTTGTSSTQTDTLANMDPLDAPCLVMPAAGQQISGTMSVGPVSAVSTFSAKAIGKVAFDGGNYDTLEATTVGDFFHMDTHRLLIYIDSAMPLFPVGTTEYGHLNGNWTKYRRFAYTDANTGQTVTPNLLGMKPNETRSYVINASTKTALAADPQPPFTGVTDTTAVTVQYVGREDVVANGTTYKHACKLSLQYDRKNNFFPKVQGTLWIAPNVGLVKLTGAPLLGVDTASVETTGIVATN